MRVLGIETSCDETAAAVLDIRGDKVKILSDVIASQVKIHAKYGGVVPEVAARKHAEVIFDVVKKALAHCQGEALTSLSRPPLDTIDLIAVTNGPGLVTSLRVGVLAAQALAAFGKKPLVGVNHIEAHLLSSFLGNKNIKFPAMGLIVSGGHTELVLIKNFGKYEMIGSTRDDAVGEAFDKVAKMLGLGYPGGPAVAKAASQRNFQFPISNFQKNSKFKIQNSKLALPRPMINSKDFDFSFAGLKTAVLYFVKKLNEKELKKLTPEICAEFQQAAIDVLVSKTIRAAKKYKAESVLLGGGVSANKELRCKLGAAAAKIGAGYFMPEMKHTGDNAAMIAFAGYRKYLRTKKSEVFQVLAEPNLVV